MATSTSLKGITYIGATSFDDQLTSNVIEFFSWGLLGAGAFFNVGPISSGAYGGRLSRMRLAEDQNYTKGRVWEAFRSNWVWESGVENSYQPIKISGIYMNGAFLPAGGTGTFSYVLNYPLGRVVFNTPITATGQVEVHYSYKYINIYSAASPWFKELQFNSFRPDSEYFTLYGSGIWSTMAQNRVQLPAMFIEPVPRRTFIPRQLGGGQWLYQDVLFHIFAETPEDRSKLVDVVTFQKYKTINLFDKDLLVSGGKWPIRYDGSIMPSALCYPDLVRQYPWRTAYFSDVYSQETENLSPGLYQAIARVTFEVVMPEL